MGKMFALVSQQEGTPRVTLKCTPPDAEVLVDRFESIMPGYYMNKRHWISISLSGELSDEMLIDLVDNSYDLVFSNLKKADKIELSQK